MKEPWRGKPCALCGKTNGYFARATYDGAPEGGIPVHQDCLAKFWVSLTDQQWRKDMQASFRRERWIGSKDT